MLYTAPDFTSKHFNQTDSVENDLLRSYSQEEGVSEEQAHNLVKCFIHSPDDSGFYEGAGLNTDQAGEWIDLCYNLPVLPLNGIECRWVPFTENGVMSLILGIPSDDTVWVNLLFSTEKVSIKDRIRGNHLAVRDSGSVSPLTPLGDVMTVTMVIHMFGNIYIPRFRTFRDSSDSRSKAVSLCTWVHETLDEPLRYNMLADGAFSYREDYPAYTCGVCGSGIEHKHIDLFDGSGIPEYEAEEF